MLETTVRAVYRDGTLELLDPLDFKNGDVLEVIVREETEEEAQKRAQVIRESFGVLKDLIDLEQFHAFLRESRELQTRPEPKLP